MDDALGRTAVLPAGGCVGSGSRGVLQDVLTGWRRAQLAQGTSTETIGPFCG